ncbi:glycosyltransferase family 2 protein [Neochlamydia sp. EPS4]|uniref:glycosyltransferase family 2 protein n=1 Tax=Neochlamydia sp. EPS4 TaxID=1478175 RepID=UPI0005D12E1F|nr:glycosyltransferase family 2 protein [Neochlamydia sp. EPS4]
MESKLSFSNPRKVDILLATYNGERYLAEQIESLLKQTHPDIHLLIRDDASIDNTPLIIESFLSKFPDRITFFQARERQGVKANFSQLMQASTSSYLMFSDQDDVWKPNKVEKSLSCMIAMENKYGELPLLVHSDLTVVDESLNLLDPSFWHYTYLKSPHSSSLNKLLTQNVVTGCTIMINRLMNELARPIPHEAFMHDWWLALIASAFGQIGVIHEATLYYRQHSTNTLGAQKFFNFCNIKKKLHKWRQADEKKFQQAFIFFHRYQQLLSLSQQKILKDFLMLAHLSWMERKKTIYRHGFFKQGWVRNLADFFLG